MYLSDDGSYMEDDDGNVIFDYNDPAYLYNDDYDHDYDNDYDDYYGDYDNNEEDVKKD